MQECQDKWCHSARGSQKLGRSLRSALNLQPRLRGFFLGWKIRRPICGYWSVDFTGSAPIANTMGMVEVARFAASAAEVPPRVTITPTRWATNSAARPERNATGFMEFEFRMSGKWVELLKEIAPTVKRNAGLRDAALGTGASQFPAIQALAPSPGASV
jgi:hypothetical protein